MDKRRLTYRSGVRKIGFTIIELVIFVFIIAIFMALSIPSYCDYSERAKAKEGLNLAGPVKQSLTEYYFSFKKFPVNNFSAGIPRASSLSGKYVDFISILNGSIIISYNEDTTAFGGETIMLTAMTTAIDISVRWSCTSGTVANKYRPAECRK